MKDLENKILEIANIKEGRLIMKPQINTDNSFDYFDGEFKSLGDDVVTRFTIEVLIVDDCDKAIETIGYASVSLVHANEYLDDTFWMMESLNQEYYDILEAMNYLEHTINYYEYGFSHPYQPFLICDRLFVKEKYRKLGIGTALIKTAVPLISCFMHKDNIAITIWQAYPLYDAKLETQKQIDEAAKELIKIYKKMGANKLHDTGKEHFFYY